MELGQEAQNLATQPIRRIARPQQKAQSISFRSILDRQIPCSPELVYKVVEHTPCGTPTLTLGLDRNVLSGFQCHAAHDTNGKSIHIPVLQYDNLVMGSGNVMVGGDGMGS